MRSAKRSVVMVIPLRVVAAIAAIEGPRHPAHCGDSQRSRHRSYVLSTERANDVSYCFATSTDLSRGMAGRILRILLFRSGGGRDGFNRHVAVEIPLQELFGVCVRRGADLQQPRILTRCGDIAELLGVPSPVTAADVQVTDEFLAPGYGHINPPTREAILTGASREALLYPIPARSYRSPHRAIAAPLAPASPP